MFLNSFEETTDDELEGVGRRGPMFKVWDNCRSSGVLKELMKRGDNGCETLLGDELAVRAVPHLMQVIFRLMVVKSAGSTNCEVVN